MSDTPARFRAAVEDWDIAAIRQLLHPEVVLHSPVTHRPFVGQEAVIVLLGHVAETFEDFRYTDQSSQAGDGMHLLVFSARVGDRELQGIDLLRTGAGGLIHDLTVMVRPLSGLIRFAEAMSARIQPPG